MDDTRPPDGRSLSFTVPSRVESVRAAATMLVQAAQHMGVPAASDSVFELAIVEALNNAVTHGSKEHAAVIVCELELGDRRLTVRVLDQGPGYDLPPLQPRPEWTADDVLSIPERGYGLPIIQSVFTATRTITRAGATGLEMSLTY